MWSLSMLVTLYYFPMLPWYVIRSVYILTMYTRSCVLLALQHKQAQTQSQTVEDDWQKIECIE